MESEESTPSTGHQPEPFGAEEGAQIPAQQPEPTGVGEDAPLSLQQPEAIGAEGVVQAAAQQPECMYDAPTVPQQLERMVARDSSSVSAQRLRPAGSLSAARIIYRIKSPLPTLRTQPVHQPPLPKEATLSSSTGSSSVSISNTTDITICSSSSLRSNHARYNGPVHTDGSENENGAGPRVAPSGILRRDTGRSMLSVPSLSTDRALTQEAIRIDHPLRSSNGSAPSNRRDSSITTTSSISLHCSTTSSGRDPTKPSNLGLESCSILDTDEGERDWMAYVKPLMRPVEAHIRYLKRFEHLQAEEYVLSVIKSYVGIASALTADMHSNAREVVDISTDGESTGRESPFLMTEEEVEQSQLCASLDRRLRAVGDYVRSAFEITTEQAMAETILREYKAAKLMDESDTLPDERSHSSRVPSSGVGHGMEVQEGGELPEAKINSHTHLASGTVKEAAMKDTSVEESGSPIQTASGSVKREGEFKADDAVEACSVKTGRTKEQSESFHPICGCSSNRGCTENDLSRHFENVYLETEKQMKVRQLHQKIVLLKMFASVEGRMCAIRTVNWVKLRCLKTVIGMVNQALEANRLAHRVLSLSAPVPSAGSSWEEAATAASQCARAAVREIEEAVQLHRLVAVDLYQAERALFGMMNEASDDASYVQLVNLGVKFIEIKVNRACRTYLDKTLKGRDSSNPENSLIFPTTDGIDSPVVSMAFDNTDDGPSDVYQALIRACHSSVNAMRKVVKGLQDFSTDRLWMPRSSDNE